MSKSQEFERLWCHKDFKKLIKSKAAERGFPSVKEYTRELAKDDEPMEFMKNDGNKKRKWKFNI